MKQTYHHKDLRNALIDEALAVLAESGLASLTLRELARRLGVTHTAPYAHFPDKAALLNGVAGVGFERLAAALAGAAADHDDPSDAFAAMGTAYVQFALQSPNLYRLMFVDPELDVADDECDTSVGQDAFEVLVEALGRLNPASEDPRRLSVVAWAMVHGIAMLEIDKRTSTKSDLTASELAAMATKVFMRGLREPQDSVLAP